MHTSPFATRMLTVIALAIPLACSAQELDRQQQAIDACRERLDEGFPWYDSGQQALRPIHVKKTRQPHPPRDWVWNTNKRPKWNWNWNWNWPNLGRVLQACVWIGLVLIIGALLYFFLRSYVLVGPRSGRGSDDWDKGHDSDVERVENLPFPVRNPTTDLLGEAQRNYRAGNFAEAIIYLFSYQLVQLDRNNLIRLTKGKTNRQYVRELSSGIDLKSILSNTMLVFEDVFFGSYPLERVRFESCWNRMDEFHRLLEEGHS